MSRQHRKPLVAFVVLAFLAAGVIGIQKADAQAGRMLAGAIGTGVRVQGPLSSVVDLARGTTTALGPVAAESLVTAAVADGPASAGNVARTGSTAPGARLSAARLSAAVHGRVARRASTDPDLDARSARSMVRRGERAAATAQERAGEPPRRPSRRGNVSADGVLRAGDHPAVSVLPRRRGMDRDQAPGAPRVSTPTSVRHAFGPSERVRGVGERVATRHGTSRRTPAHSHRADHFADHQQARGHRDRRGHGHARVPRSPGLR